MHYIKLSCIPNCGGDASYESESDALSSRRLLFYSEFAMVEAIDTIDVLSDLNSTVFFLSLI